MHRTLYLVVKAEGDLQERVPRWIAAFVGAFRLTAAISAVWIAVSDYGVTDTFKDDVWTALLYTAGVQYLFSGKVKLTDSSY